MYERFYLLKRKVKSLCTHYKCLKHASDGSLLSFANVCSIKEGVKLVSV